MTVQKSAFKNYQRQLFVLFVLSVISGLSLLSFNRTTYNMWFLGLVKGQWTFLPMELLSMSELVDYWNWKPGRFLVLLCLFAWMVAIAAAFGLLVLNIKMKRKSD